MNQNFITTALIPFILTLTACGGGDSDDSGNSNTIAAPVITLIGESTVTVEALNTYTDEGATANDNTDGDLTSQIAVVNPTDTTTIDTYTVTYNVSDSSGNAASQVSRTVNVVDTTAPVITLIGDATVSVEVGSEYVDEGATATDSFDGSLTPVLSSTVNTNVLGQYTVTYTVFDSSSNAAEVTRTVNVESVFHVSNTAELREALNTAATNGFDDTIILADGVYKTTGDGNGVFTYQSNEENKLTLKGSSPDNVILSGDNTNPILLHASTKDAPLFLEKLTFKDGYSEDELSSIVEADDRSDVAYCNFIDNHSYLSVLSLHDETIISNSRFENNQMTYGSAVSLSHNYVSAKITESTFIQNNTINGNGGAVYVKKGVEVIDSVFDGNSALTGGAIYTYATVAYTSGVIKITGSAFRNNTATSTNRYESKGGGAIVGRHVDVFNSVFESNVSSKCGVAIYSSGNVRVENSIIANNSADEEEEAVSEDTVINGCSAGGIRVAGNITSLNSLYTGNSSAINLYGENNILINNIFIDNTQFDISTFDFEFDLVTGIIEILNNNYIDEARLTIPYFSSNNIFDEFNLGFIDEANGDYRLTLDSDLIDIGTTDIEGVNFPETDLDGKARISGDSIDIGPYEYQHSN